MKSDIRKFAIGDRVKRTSTGDIGIVVAYDLLPEVYGLRKEKGGYAMWGELEMEFIGNNSALNAEPNKEQGALL